MRKATIANKEILIKHGATEIEFSTNFDVSESCGIEYRGWKFHSSHNKICDETEIIQLAKNISESCDTSSVKSDEDTITINGINLHIPPMIFGNDIINCHYLESSLNISFDAEDALTTWALQHCSQDIIEKKLGPNAIGCISSGNTNIVQVPFLYWTTVLPSGRTAVISFASTVKDIKFKPAITKHIITVFIGFPPKL